VKEGWREGGMVSEWKEHTWCNVSQMATNPARISNKGSVMSRVFPSANTLPDDSRTSLGEFTQ
jgi:hypothetical protein